MISLIEQFLAPFSIRIMAFTAIIVAIILTLLGARQAGRNAERAERMRRTIEVQREQLDAASRRPRDRDELARRMRDGSF